MIVHLENTIEMQDLELEERAAMIAPLKQQLQAPPALEDLTKPDAVPDVNED
jgi:hypothetical protein